MGDARHGIGAIVREAGPLPPADEAEALDLFDGDAAIGSPIDGSGVALQRPTTPRGRGRPTGARNVTTEETKRFLLSRYRHPLLGLFDVASTSPAELARLMVPKGERVEAEDLKVAWRLWFDCAKEAAEYVTPKEPRALTITPGSAPLLSMNLNVDQLTLAGVTAEQAMSLGIPENAIQSALSDPVGREVLEAEVLEAGNSPDKSNG